MKRRKRGPKGGGGNGPIGGGGNGPIGGGERNRKTLQEIATAFRKLAALFTRLSNQHIPGIRG